MRKGLLFLSVLSILIFLPGCFSENKPSGVAYDYNERCWIDGHWVYRFKEKDNWIYRHWEKNRWEEEIHKGSSWEQLKWEKNPMLLVGAGTDLKTK